MTIPMGYTIVWISVFGGAALRSFRRAEFLIDLASKLSGLGGNAALGMEPSNFTDMFAADRPSCYDYEPGMLADAGLEGDELLADWDVNIGPVCMDVGENSWFNMVGSY